MMVEEDREFEASLGYIVRQFHEQNFILDQEIPSSSKIKNILIE